MADNPQPDPAGQGAPPAKEPQAQTMPGQASVSAPAGGDVVLKLTEPYWQSAMVFPEEGPEGADITVTKDGTSVPAGKADDLIQRASDSGVTLTKQEG